MAIRRITNRQINRGGIYTAAAQERKRLAARRAASALANIRWHGNPKAR